MAKNNNKYYGSEEVKDMAINEKDRTTTITLEKGKKEVVPNKLLPHVLTDERSDLTTLRNLRTDPVVENVLQVFLDWDVKTSEIEYIMTKVITSLNVNLKEADSILWGVPQEDKRVSQVDKVLKEHAEAGTPGNKPK